MADHANGHADLEQRKRELALTDDDLPAGYAEGVARAREFAASWQQRYNLQRQQQQQAQLLQEAAALARHVLVCSRVYVGSLGLDVSKDDLARVFESFGYVKTVDMSFDSATGKHKGFCFIEYECPEPATAAITQLQGAQLGGRSLKLGRPNNVPTDLPNMGLPAPVPERVYIGNVHQDISERDISSVFEAFGKVAECALIPDPITRKHKSYGYIQYESVSSAEAAVVGMNSFELGGRRLVVTRTIMGGPMPLGMSSMPPMPAVVPAAVTGSRLQLVVPPTSSLAITAQPPSAVVNPIMEQVNAKAASINAGVAAHAPPPLPILRTAAAQALPPPLPGLAPVPLPAMPAEARADDGSLTGEETVAISGRQRFEVMQVRLLWPVCRCCVQPHRSSCYRGWPRALSRARSCCATWFSPTRSTTTSKARSRTSAPSSARSRGCSSTAARARCASLCSLPSPRRPGAQTGYLTGATLAGNASARSCTTTRGSRRATFWAENRVHWSTLAKKRLTLVRHRCLLGCRAGRCSRRPSCSVPSAQSRGC
eukprot:Unigene7126_Nuclearia_a/m.21856 Unigene7126_Nuclearia_a/g.21856  ORF Unigene7126_Nuclearia_a/g.21856 Unigene7126_Nuclearia_a/m.21856 type:complete len:541 (-) Unigene7126_Nuclearia_a:205-1827(-)